MRHAAVAPTSHPALQTQPWPSDAGEPRLPRRQPGPGPQPGGSERQLLSRPRSQRRPAHGDPGEGHSTHVPQGPLTPDPSRAGTLAQNQNIKAGAPETYDSQTSIRRKQPPNGCGVWSQLGLPWGSGSEHAGMLPPGAQPTLPCTHAWARRHVQETGPERVDGPRSGLGCTLGGEPCTPSGSPSQGGTSETELTATLWRIA